LRDEELNDLFGSPCIVRVIVGVGDLACEVEKRNASKLVLPIILIIHNLCSGDRGRVAQWLRCCATNRKIAGSIPDGVIGIFQ